MLSVSQEWKEKLGNYLIPNRDLLTPEELIKIEYAIDGQTLVFDKSDIISFSHKNSVDLNSLTLPKNEIQFEIDNTDGRWNPDNPQGLYEKIIEKQKVDVYYGIKVPATKTYTNIMPERADAYYRTVHFKDHMTYLNSASGWYYATPFMYYFTPEEDGLYYIGYETWFEAGVERQGFDVYLQHDFHDTSTEEVVILNRQNNPIANQHYSHAGYYSLTGGREYYFTCLFRNYESLSEVYCAPFIVKVDNNTDIPSGKMFLLDETYDVVHEWHKAGTFYMSGWDCPQNGLTATFTATSQLDFGKNKFGEVSYATEPTMFNVCYTALVHMGMDPSHTSTFARIDNSLKRYYVPYKEGTTYTVDIFKDTTDAQVVQYCANAAMCRIRYNTSGKIYIEPMETETELSDYIIDLFTSYHQPEYVLSKQIKDVIINSDLTVSLAESGENQQISNPLITAQLHANLFAGWLGRVLNTRKTISGEYRCDPRIQPYDYVKTINKYAVNETFITDVTISYGGSFKATYTGRVMKSIPSEDIYGLFYAGDKQRAGNSIS